MSTKLMMRIAGIALAGSMLAGCGAFGGSSSPQGPDEFTVVGRAPLVIPPESDLRPPRPGEPRPQEIDPSNRAMRALFPKGTKTPPKPSKSEQTLLDQVSSGANADIRSNAGLLDLEVARKSLILADILAAGERQNNPDNISVTRIEG